MPLKSKENFINSTKMNAFITDQEDVAKAMINKNSEILMKKVNGDLPIHIAAKMSTSE